MKEQDKVNEIILKDLEKYLSKTLKFLNGISVTCDVLNCNLIYASRDYYFRFVIRDMEIEEYLGDKVAFVSDPNYREKVKAFMLKEVASYK